MCWAHRTQQLVEDVEKRCGTNRKITQQMKGDFIRRNDKSLNFPMKTKRKKSATYNFLNL